MVTMTLNDGGPVNHAGFGGIVWLIAGILFIIWLIIEIFQKLT
jgi:hypothetical protein